MFKISFCTVCRNRLEHLKETIFSNLEKIVSDNNSELVLLNYNDSEGLDDFVNENLLYFIKKQKLIYLKENASPFFDFSKSKNIAHFAANGDFLLNLDADNFLTNGIIASYRKIWSDSPNILIHGYSKNYGGTHGRIGVSKQVFYKLGGYDEDIGFYYEDHDFIKRGIKCGLKYANIFDDKNVQCIEHAIQKTTENASNPAIEANKHFLINKTKSESKSNVRRNSFRRKCRIVKNFSQIIYI